jgi:sodium/hydrogen exchanger-like protein 6/7
MVLTDILNATIEASEAFSPLRNTTVGGEPSFGDKCANLSNIEKDKQEAAFILTMLFLMLIFFFGAGVMEKYKPRCGHETGVVVLIGVLLSVILWFTKGDELLCTFSFSERTFFDFFLPPIIFNAGYNMRRTKFF